MRDKAIRLSLILISLYFVLIAGYRDYIGENDWRKTTHIDLNEDTLASGVGPNGAIKSDTGEKDTPQSTTSAIITPYEPNEPNEELDHTYYYRRQDANEGQLFLAVRNAYANEKIRLLNQHIDADFYTIEVCILESGTIKEVKRVATIPVYNQTLINFSLGYFKDIEHGYQIIQYERWIGLVELASGDVYWHFWDSKPFSHVSSDKKTDAFEEKQLIYLYENGYKVQYFDINKKSFVSEKLKIREELLSKGESLEGVRLVDVDFTSNPELTSSSNVTPNTEEIPLRTITNDPVLSSIALNMLGTELINQMGLPDKVDWWAGNYLAYEDLMVYAEIANQPYTKRIAPGDTVSVGTVRTVIYDGSASVIGLKVGDSLKDVEAKLGKIDAIGFHHWNEMSYPAAFSVIKEDLNLSISVWLNPELCIEAFAISVYEKDEGITERSGIVFSDGIKIIDVNDPVLDSLGNEAIHSAYEAGDAIYFNTDKGFFTLSRYSDSAIQLAEQEMTPFFEMLTQDNPTVFTIGNTDQKIHKIDLILLTDQTLSNQGYTVDFSYSYE